MSCFNKDKYSTFLERFELIWTDTERFRKDLNEFIKTNIELFFSWERFECMRICNIGFPKKVLESCLSCHAVSKLEVRFYGRRGTFFLGNPILNILGQFELI